MKSRDNLKKKDSKDKKSILNGNSNRRDLDSKEKEKRSGLDFKENKNQKIKESKRNWKKLNKKKMQLFQEQKEKK